MSTPPSKGKLLYHLTALANIESIFEHGLLSRDVLQNVDVYDVADTEILAHREEYKLHNYVPFHFFPGTPFSGSVQSHHEEDEFVYISISREFASKYNFKIIPCHPLSYKAQPLAYKEGIKAIDWQLMEQRNYKDHDCKMACMAECITDEGIHPDDFQSIFVKSNEVKQKVISSYKKKRKKDPPFYINVSGYMFKQ